MAKLTNMEFAGVAAGLSRDAASWAASLCALPARANEPTRSGAVARFVAEMRDRLELLEQWAAEEPNPHTPASGALKIEEADRDA
ncbi:hypothetical protein [Methylorubrum extorquens]|uniref:hypothetical protein n=1 Tax=Methylorubrum extorquens TaxID=408 RepID=UPI002237E8C6|nr:hypothetical protein [Methylorubrum extorquens]UYW32464.1 hypothetical protein OKB92_26460 [Methylorubrum extorquens]